jgi:hypothetical protein
MKRQVGKNTSTFRRFTVTPKAAESPGLRAGNHLARKRENVQKFRAKAAQIDDNASRLR